MFKVCYVGRTSRKLADKSKENVKMSIGKMCGRQIQWNCTRL